MLKPYLSPLKTVCIMRKISLLIAAIFMLFQSSSPAQTLEQELQNVFTDFQLMGMSVWTACGADEEQYHFGLRDFTRTLPMDADSRYRIASVSKTFTALGLMKLYDDGLFDLDDNISDYMGYTIQNPSYPGTTITFRMLLSHTSSLQDGSGYNSFLSGTLNTLPVPSIAEVLVPGGQFFTNNMWRTEAPGTHFAYSNINYGLIGTLIEQLSGERFDLYMKEHILEPLGIAGSYNVTLLDDIDDVVVLYRNINGAWTAQIDNYQGVMPTAPNLDGSAEGLVSDSNCFVAGNSPGCEDPACQAAICADDAWCCTNEWDIICVNAALAICDGSPSSCLSEHGGVGCDNNDCQQAVCAINASCCEVSWNAACADLAWQNCGPEAYVPGTNGALFAPQGGLRASAQEVGKMIQLLRTLGESNPGFISTSALEEMTAVEWNFTGGNGDNYFGLFNRWGLGVHHANTQANDQICLNQGWGSMIGHPGEAYGLVSSAYYSELGDVSFVFMHNGIWPGYAFGEESIWYLLEEAVFDVLCNHFSTCITTAVTEKESGWSIFPNPFADRTTLMVPEALAGNELFIRVFNAQGKEVVHERITGNMHYLHASSTGRGMLIYQIVANGAVHHTGKLIAQ